METLEKKLVEETANGLTQMEGQMAAQTGYQVKISPESNPEFVKRKKEILAQYNEQFQQQLDMAKEQLKEFPNIA